MSRHPLGLTPVLPPEGFPGRVDFVKSAAHIKDAPSSVLPEIAVCGRSNVGKSSLLNTLCNRRQMARVSTTPGRTRLINFFDVQSRVMFVDLPGFGFATGSRAEIEAWGDTIQSYLRDRPQLCLTLILFDARRLPEKEEQELLLWFRDTGRPCLGVMTKSDKVGRSELESRRRKAAELLFMKPADVIAFSSLDRSGREPLWSSILAAARVFSEERPGSATSIEEQPAPAEDSTKSHPEQQHPAQTTAKQKRSGKATPKQERAGQPVPKLKRAAKATPKQEPSAKGTPKQEPSAKGTPKQEPSAKGTPKQERPG
jgi:GTP-binding protein